jgi:hypothetical protein
MPDRRPPAKSFQDLLVWRKAHKLVLAVYALTATFPKSETYGLALQMRRAAVSIPANIAEGFRRRGKADKARFLNIAEGVRRGMPLLPDPGERPRVWRYSDHCGAGRSQPPAWGVHRRHSDFLDSWLLTPNPAGISRAKPLVSWFANNLVPAHAPRAGMTRLDRFVEIDFHGCDLCFKSRNISLRCRRKRLAPSRL